MADVRRLAVCSAVFLLLLLPTHAHSFHLRKRAQSDGPPVRPSNFRSVSELQKYLADLTDYYTVLGRPRFGKRSTSPVNADLDDLSLTPYGLNMLKRRLFRNRADLTSKDINDGR